MTLALIPAFSPGEKEKRSQRLDVGMRRMVQGFKARMFRGILTLTLSRWERGQLLDGFLKFVSHPAEFSRGHAKTRSVFLPLPAGEGWGEGECRISQGGYGFS